MLYCSGSLITVMGNVDRFSRRQACASTHCGGPSRYEFYSDAFEYRYLVIILLTTQNLFVGRSEMREFGLFTRHATCLLYFLMAKMTKRDSAHTMSGPLASQVLAKRGLRSDAYLIS
ncbi:hypothetical protein M378DRAFT_1003868 [Amanita muscaria Koide BX008]|uniref:Uncharacterized protein n=1 Tax=Amanita muscaria (strain Koide BX008) TaxID=946122 RepID=A0A0C2SZ50_AMAMK|nr:hypothetical protein M378DRAFT_1003868 [Amanita muscaria Koide BX008]